MLWYMIWCRHVVRYHRIVLCLCVCVCSIPPTANCEGLCPSKHTLKNNIEMFRLYRCVKTMAQMKTAMYCFVQHTHAPNSKNIKQKRIIFVQHAAFPANLQPGFTNTPFSRLPTIGPSVAIPNQSKSLIMVGVHPVSMDS